MTTQEILEAARGAKAALALADSTSRAQALHSMAAQLCSPANMTAILAANADDMAAAKGHISEVMLDRLALTEERIRAMAKGIEEVAALPDPVGRVLKRVERPNGLVIEKTAVPMGVIAIIYESRPNVTSDAAALAIKSGNACILRCGKEAWRSANAIVQALRQGLRENSLPENAVCLIEDTTHASANALMTAVSGDDGSFSFENVPYGNWYIREIKQPTGFVLDDTVYDVNISENEQVVEIEIVNELVRGNIALTKVDAEYTDTKLTGAVFEVYKDSNDNGELDSEDELIGTLTEKEIGQYEMNDLLYGRYFILESASPDSYIRDEGVYEVFIDTDGKTYQVENTEGKGFANEPMRGNLKIVKTSSDGKVEGFAFRITGANGYDVTLETDENGEIFLEGLRIGEYKISEVNNSASAMYILPADKEAAVQTGSTTVVEMHNELRDTPKTGDDSKLGLWLVLAGVSVAGIAACGIIGFKKKKKEDN